VLPGYSGRLISESFLERHLAADPNHGVDAGRSMRLALGAARRRSNALGPASGLRSILELGAEPFLVTLGLPRPSTVERSGDVLVATVAAHERPVALVVAPWRARLDPLWRTAVVSARQRGARWVLLFNGMTVRLVSASRLYSRRYAEFDLDLAADDDRTAAAAAALLGGDAVDRLVEASDRDSAAVCRALRNGVLEASAEVLAALLHRAPPPAAATALDQALTIVYRILFLLFAEARRLVPLWHPVYRESYSIDRLAAAAARGGPPSGMWDALRAVSRLAHAGCKAGDLRVNAFNGRLFAPSRTPLVERRDLDDERARRAIVAMVTRPAADRAGLERIAYRDLGVEQLGAVYETLLDYTPKVEAPLERRSPPRVSLVSGSGVRKATGTFYTPEPIARYLVRRALQPLVHGKSAPEVLSLKVLDPAMGSGAFLVAACRFLAEAYEAALVADGACHQSDLGPRERASIRRTIAEQCLFGVDLNPMAVQLARLSLWLATLAGDRPLSFLDHHLQTGDSLVGAWLHLLRAPPAVCRRTTHAIESLFADSVVTDAIRHAVPVRFRLATMPNDSPDDVREKERALGALVEPGSPLSKWKRIADLWCAHWFAAGAAPASAFGALSDFVLTGGSALPPRVAERYIAQTNDAADGRRFFHWELEFPEVFFDRNGDRLTAPGFDAVVGNPPWDMVRGDSGAGNERFRARRDATALVRFTRDSGAYDAQSAGHANRYQLFVERAIALSRPGGRIGLVLPSGLMTDLGSAELRRFLFSKCGVDALVGFDNRDGVFPIHRGVRFQLLTATQGVATSEFGCRLGERDLSVLDADEDQTAPDRWFPVRVTPSLIRRLSGDDLSLPDLRSPTDLAIAERLAALYAPLGSDEGWGARFGRELNASDDRDVLLVEGNGLPIVEGKHVEPFRANLGSARWRIAPQDAVRLLGARHNRARLAYRDVASPTNRLTLISALLPAGCVSTHTLFCLRTPLSLESQHFLCGMFNSFVLNFLARLRVGTHVTTAIVERLPVPGPLERPAAFHEIAMLARLLGRRQSPEAMAQLNAAVAKLYELSETEFLHVLQTFPLVPQEERAAALTAFRAG
jgi:hypothetical protein